MNRLVYVLNGPNLNLLGQRQPEIYGRETLADVERDCRTLADELGLALRFHQSNREYELIDWIHEARGDAAAIVINPAAFTHTSVALLDALNAFEGAVIEVHISNVHKRESFRHHSFVSLRADGVIAGLGTQGYGLALRPGRDGAGMIGRRKAIATVALSGTLADKLEAAALVGFDAVEVMEADLLAFDGTPTDLRRLAEDLGLALDLYQPFRDFEAMPEPQRARNMDRAERKFDVMQEMGAELVLVCSNTQDAAIDDDQRAAADLREMAERADRRGLRVGFEALSWGRHIRLWRHAWNIVSAADHPALGLIVDSFHTLALGDDPAGLADLPGDRIFFVQLADAPKRDMDVLSWSRHFRSFPGQGDLDVDGFVQAVLASGYAGPLSLEVFNDQFRSAPSRMIARDGLRSLILAEATATGAGLPETSAVHGFEFVEFAVDATARLELAGLLARLGFGLAGRHRTKDVELWRQGGINLVLNSEQDSAASEHFQHHGPSVCALALRVDDPARVVERARALLIPDWRERIGAGEAQIPAVRGPDGTLIYLIGREQDFWSADFELSPTSPAGAGLERIDHLALALPAWQLDTYVLFWRSLFGLAPQPVFDLPDPFGLIQSRAMVNEAGTLRLTFNISEAQDTVTNRFVSAFAGAGVHHVALSTADAAASMAALEADQAPTLAIPPNYYEDLGARFPLDGDTLLALEVHDILYDAAGEGEFRHAYTDAFQSRFFFEIVERRGGYAGFGAVNAAIRMAAQARRYVPTR